MNVLAQLTRLVFPRKKKRNRSELSFSKGYIETFKYFVFKELTELQ